MTLRQLRYVVAVDRQCHFGRAAEACHVTQPTLSTQIRKLEDELGGTLFDRSRQPVCPTALGTRVAEQARRVLRESRRVVDLAQEAEEHMRGELRLGLLPTLAPYLLPLVAAPFAEAYPDATVTVHEVRTTTAREEMAADRLDAALIATDEEGLALRPLFEEPFVAYVAEGHPLAEADEIDPHALEASEMWLLREGHCFRDQVLDLCARASEANAQRPLRLESGALETLRLMVDRAGGLTLLPHLATHAMSAEQRARVRPFAPPVPKRTIRLAQMRPQLKQPLTRAYAQGVQDAVRPLLMHV